MNSSKNLSLRIIFFILWLIELVIQLFYLLPNKYTRRKLGALKFKIRSYLWSILVKRYRNQSILVKGANASWLIPLTDGPINQDTFTRGGYNDLQFAKLIAFLKGESRLQAAFDGDKMCLDIGANIGTSAILLAKSGLFSKIHAIEPDPTNYYYLSQNVMLNHLAGIIKVHNIAISDRDGTVNFELSPDNCGDHRVVADSTDHNLKQFHEDERKIIQVDCITLDNFFGSQGISTSELGLLWSDTQGHEGHVFGSSAMLKQNPIPIYCELWPYGLQRSGGFTMFVDLIREHYSSFVNFYAPHLSVEPTEKIDQLIDEIQTYSHTEALFF